MSVVIQEESRVSMRERTGGRMEFDVLEEEKEASRWMMGVCVYFWWWYV